MHSRDFLAYVACRTGSALEVLRVSGEGRIARVQALALPGHCLPVAFHPTLAVAYASLTHPQLGAEVSHVAVLDVAADGRCTVAQTVGAPGRLAHLAVHDDGTHLFSVSFPKSLLVVHAIDAQGYLREEPVAVKPTGLNPHQVSFGPGLDAIYVPCMNGDVVQRFGFTPGAPALQLLDDSALVLAPRSGPRHMVWTGPTFAHAYLVQECDGNVSLLARDGATARLAVRQQCRAARDEVGPVAWAAEVKLSPDGRHLYATERKGNTVARWAVGADLSLGDRVLFPCEAGPRGMDMSPCGAFVVVAGQQDGQVGVYRRDPLSGSLALVDRVPVSEGPCFVACRPMAT